MLGGAVLLAASWIFVVARDNVPLWEERLFSDINDLPGFLWPIVWVPMQSGSLVGSLVVVALIGIISRSWRLTAAALVASQVAWWGAKWVKGLVGTGPSERVHRRRPPPRARRWSRLRVRSRRGGVRAGRGGRAVAAPPLAARRVDRRGRRGLRSDLRRRPPTPRRRRRRGIGLLVGHAHPVGVRPRRRGSSRPREPVLHDSPGPRTPNSRVAGLA